MRSSPESIAGALLLCACGSTSPSGSADRTPPDAAETTTVPIALSGCSTAFYAVRATIGNESFALMLDTGSATLAVASAGCACGGATPTYSPATSAMDEGRESQSSYDTGESGWSGEVYRDTVEIGPASAQMDLVAMQSEEGFSGSIMCDTPTGSVPTSRQGIIGFGSSSELAAGTNSFMDNLVAAGQTKNLFALELCHSGGTLWLGGFDPAEIAGTLQYAPLIQAPALGVTLGSLGIDAGTVTFAAGTTALLDSGGPPIIVPDSAFHVLADALATDAAFVQTFGPSWFSAAAGTFQVCTTLDETPDQVDAALPALAVGYGDASSVTLKPSQSYLRWLYGTLDGPSPGQYTYCQNLIDGGPHGLGMLIDLGQSLMLGHVVVYDRANGRLGVGSSRTCL
jgi:Eukaryotic aspartyl protease